MTSKQILNQTDLMVKNENLSDREIDLLNLIRDLNTRLDEALADASVNAVYGLSERMAKLESRISTVQDDILRVERSVQTLADDTSRMIAGPLPELWPKGIPVVSAKWSSQPPEGIEPCPPPAK